jgi:hypothetical protein
MKSLIVVAVMLVAAKANASTVINNAVAVNVSVTTSAASNTMIDLAPVDSASWQMNFTCAKGSATIQQSNDGVNFVDLNVAGSSFTFQQAALATSSNNLYAIPNPAYRYVNFKVTNSSVPVAAITASPCTFKATQLLRSATITSN